ncbi:MAG: BlaI/MecI/CopY family transcriptional regulator [Robiginitomaculum sp.]|nr:BlaI/MecI/CopY family transcriptional regulator [Robiginitomaculum sp.]
MSSKKPSEAEVEILQILWERQPCSVRIVHENISRFKDVGYTTTLKQLQRMQDKGLVSREPGEGKSFKYSAVEEAGTTQSKLLSQLLKPLFEAMLMNSSCTRSATLNRRAKIWTQLKNL